MDTTHNIASMDDLDLRDLDPSHPDYIQTRNHAFRRIVLWGIKQAFSEISDLETVFVDRPQSSPLRTCIRSNPDLHEYAGHLALVPHDPSPECSLDRRFDEFFSSILQRLGQPMVAAAILLQVIGPSAATRDHPMDPVCITRSNHLHLIDYLLTPRPPLGNPPVFPLWNASAMAMANAAVMDTSTPPATTSGKSLRL